MDRCTLRQSMLFGDRPKYLTLYLTDPCKVPKSMGLSKQKGKRKEIEKSTALRNVKIERRLDNPGTMEFNMRHFIGEHNCPVECFTKSLLFIVITVFILYLPLGDLSGYCEQSTCGRKTTAYLATSRSKDNYAAVCCFCDVYKMMLKGAHVALHTIELFLYVMLDILYEAKLKFYSLLEALDRHDLCRSVCCKDDEVNQNAATEKRTSCRCGKGKTCKYRS